ncbi:MAG TPA: hypothetical protein PLY90_07490 [Candidatus Hydrogenedentes bacterium]|nr:hypothetical protein [Candidatus Hydrogenedentota bacterium]HQB03125.1 hypothetical protein [Candidatus Hydrogenedentota bacterium]
MPKSLKLPPSVIYIVILVALAGTLVYINTFHADWVWDDVSSVLLHKHVQTPSSVFQLFLEDQHAFGRGQGNFYRPLVSLSFLIDYQLAGGSTPIEGQSSFVPQISPFVFHLTNLAWHLAAALCLLGLLAALNAPYFVLLAVPLIYVLHPLHTEAVAYISGRADMMSATGIFGALWSSVCYLKSAGRRRYLFFMILCFTGALLSKESSLIFPFLLTLLLLTTHREPLSESLSDSSKKHCKLHLFSASFIILLVYILLRSTVLRFATESSTASAAFSERAFETFQSLGIYLKLLFAPFHLHMERTLTHAGSLHFLAGCLFFVALLGAIACSFAKKQSFIGIGALWFLISWMPISGLFPLNAPMAEHWMYVPMAGFWLCLAAILKPIVSHPQAKFLLYGILGLFCLFLGTLTIQRNTDWSDNERLFLATLRENPESARVHYNLAVTYSNLVGNDAAAKRHYEIFLNLRSKERAQHPDKAGLIIDDEIDARLALGKSLMNLSAYTEALGIYTPLIALAEFEVWRPTAALAALRSGLCMLALGEIAQSNAYFQQAMTLEPLYAPDVERIIRGENSFHIY